MKLVATHMNFWRRCVKRTWLRKEPNRTITEIVEVNVDTIDENQKKTVVWYEHASRMQEVVCTKNILEWITPGRRRQDCKDDLANIIEQTGHNEEDWLGN